MYHMNKKHEANALVIECITSALLEMMKKKPFNSITITDLTKRAGVGRVSFYRNFDSKEDVLKKHLHDLFEDWIKEHEGETNCSWQLKMFKYYYKYKDLYIMLYKQGLAHISLQSVKDACGPKPEQPNVLAYITAFISYGIYGWLEEWFKRGLQETPEEMIKLYEQAQQIEK